MLRAVGVSVVLISMVLTLYANVIYTPEDAASLRQFSTGCILVKIDDEGVLPSLLEFNREANTQMRMVSKKVGIYLVKFETVFSEAEMLHLKSKQRTYKEHFLNTISFLLLKTQSNIGGENA